MLNYYQPWLLPFLQAKSSSVPMPLTMRYYHSFEDGLWDLIRHKFPSKKKVSFLVPDFYCSDVLDNLISHGFSYTYYPLDANFQISASHFKKYLWLYHPDIVIIFHACGITSNLLKDSSWLSDLPKTSILVEDSVHRLVDPQSIHLIHPHHVVMDSLRKDSPFPGSRMFGSPEFINFGKPFSHLTIYQLQSFFYYFLFRFLLKLGFLLSSSSLTIFAHEKILKTHDDLVGDSFTPHSGLSFYLPFIRHLNYQKIAALKAAQIELYESCLSSIFSNPKFFQVSIPESDYPHMHVYPLGLNTSHPENLVSYLHHHKIPVWAKFTDTPWSAARSVLFLPLGFHVSAKEIHYLANHLASCS
jgi:hypothetical protein